MGTVVSIGVCPSKSRGKPKKPRVQESQFVPGMNGQGPLCSASCVVSF